MHKPDQFQIIVTDIEMPVMDGLEFAAACRAHPTLSGVPLVAYTASVSPATEHSAISAGVDRCIVKTDRPGLLQAIAELLSVNEEMMA